MLDTNHNNSNCEFAAETISYLYDEIAAREKTEFEAHLQFCSSCAKEIAGFNLVRSSIFELKDEFSALQTPAIVFPIKVSQNPPAAISTPKNSWLDGWRKLFSFSPARSVAVFAALLVCAGLTIFAVKFSSDSNKIEVAESEANKNTAPIVSATVEKKIEKLDENKNAKENSSDTSFEPQKQKANGSEREPVEAAQTNTPVVKEPVVKVSTSPRKTTIDNKFSQKSNNSPKTEGYKENRKSTPAQAQKVPKLVEDDEAEDDSVRLADLFDEIDTK